MLREKEDEVLRREMVRMDSSFKDFLYVTNFTSVYHHTNDEWNKLNIEGTFVMYTRTNDLLIDINVLNRKNLTDFVFSVGKETQVGIVDGFMAMRNGEDDDLYGFWFCNNDHPRAIVECLKIHLKTQ